MRRRTTTDTTPRRERRADPLEREMEAALQPGRFISYGAGSDFVEGLDRVEDRIAKLVRTRPERAAALYETFLAGCYEKAEELDDSSGGFGMFVDRLFCGWVKARQAAGADPDDTAGRLLARMDDDPYGFCHRIERDLVKVMNGRSLAAFERRVRERFEGRAGASPGPGGSERDRVYERRRAADILRAILAKRRNVDAYAALCEATELSSADCLALAGMLRARGRRAEALAWVNRGRALEEQPSLSLAADDLRKLERDLLLELGRGDAALQAAWADFERDPSRDSYADLMRCVPKGERPAWHAKAMDAASRADLDSQIELWLETKETDRLVERLRKARDAELEGLSHYATEPVAKRLAKTHPDVAAKVYRALGTRILEAKKSTYYHAALAHFEDARRCYERAGLAAKWASLVRKVRARHSGKTGFMTRFEAVAAGAGAGARPGFLERAKARWPTSRET